MITPKDIVRVRHRRKRLKIKQKLPVPRLDTQEADVSNDKLERIVTAMVKVAPCSKSAVIRYLRAMGACGKLKAIKILEGMVRDKKLIHHGHNRGAKLYLPEQAHLIPKPLR